MEDTKGAKRMENFFNKQLENPISKLEEETHQKRKQLSSKTAQRKRMDKNKPKEEVNGNEKQMIVEGELNKIVKLLSNKNTDIKQLIVTEWSKFKREFDQEAKIADNSKLIDMVDLSVSSWEPKQNNPFKETPATDRITLWCSMIISKLIKDINEAKPTTEEAQSFKPWSELMEDIKINSNEMGQKIQKEIEILRDKVESIKTRRSNWREAFIHNPRKFKNGIALIEAKQKVTKKTVYWDRWYDRWGKARLYYYIKEGKRYIGFKEWYSRNWKNWISGKKLIINKLKENRHKELPRKNNDDNNMEI